MYVLYLLWKVAYWLLVKARLLCLCKRISCSPVTVARLRRSCTDFPILPGLVIQATRC
jgi:hypothetical protein